MSLFADLWLPILVSAAFVFIVSSILHMCLQYHWTDHTKLKEEGAVLEAMRTQGVTPGSYVFPRPGSVKEMGTPEMLEKYRQGPVGFMIVLPNGPVNMGKSLTLWFLYSVLVSIFVGYLGKLGLAPGADYHAVFRFTCTAAFLGYGMGAIVDTIWKGVRWSVTLKFLFDGAVYGLVTAGTFGWLWPSPVA